MPIGGASDPQVDLDRLDQGAQSLPVDPATAYGAAFGQAFDPRPALQFGKHLVLDTLGIDPADPVRQGDSFGDVDTRVDPETLNGQYGVDGYLRFNAPATADDAAWRATMAREAQFNDGVLAHSNPNPLLTVGSSLAGSLVNPANVAIMAATDGVGGAAADALGSLGRAGETGLAVTRLGRIANVLGEGAAAQVPFVAANADIDIGNGQSYGGVDALRDIATGAILHTGLHALFGGIGALRGSGEAPGAAPDAQAQADVGEPAPVSGAPGGSTVNELVPTAGVPEGVDALPPTSRQGAFALAVDQMANDRPVDVGGLVSRELEPPTLDRLDEQSALPAIDSFRPGDEATAVTPRGTEIPVQYGLAELGDLTTSHDDNLAVNPAYPAELQPRARDRAGAQARNYQLESELNPKLLMTDTAAGGGAPIVAPDGVVESGNGRTIALRRSAANGTPAYAAYRAELEARGFDTTGMDRPALVRMRTEPLSGAQRSGLAREMNADVTERMGATEQATADAARIDDGMFEHVAEGQSPASSRDFARAFIARVAPDQANTLVNADGSLSPEGARRIKAAVVARAYNDPKLVGQLFEDEETPARQLSEGLAAAAPAWAKLAAAASSGAVPRELDLTDALRSAMDLVRHARDLGRPLGELVQELQGQGDMFSGDALSPFTEAFLRLFYRDEDFKKPLAASKVAWALKDYARQALEVEPGENLFGETPDVDTARQILSNTADKFARGDAGDIDTVRAPGRSVPDDAGAGPADNAGKHLPGAVGPGNGPGRGLSPEGERLPDAEGRPDRGEQHRPDDGGRAELPPGGGAARGPGGSDGRPLATLDGHEVVPEGIEGKEALTAARAWYDANLRPLKVESAALGQEVGFSRVGRNKSTSFAGDARKLAVLPALPDLIRDGRLVRSEPPRDATQVTVKAIHTLEGEIDLAGERLGVRVQVRETTDGSFHYDHYVLKRSPAAPDARFDPATKQGDGTSGGETQPNMGEAPVAVNRGAQAIAADPELKAIEADNRQLADQGGVDEPDTPANQNPDTLADAIRAAGVCLEGEGL